MTQTRKNQILNIISRLDAELKKEFSQYSKKNLNNMLISYERELKET